MATETAEYAPTTERLLNEIVDDTYRYACPECSSVSVVVRRKLGSPKEYLEAKRDDSTIGTMAQQTDGMERIHDFRCNICSATFDDPYDKRAGERRVLRSEHNLIGGY